MTADDPQAGSAEPQGEPDAELEETLGEDDGVDAVEDEVIIPGLPHGLAPRQKLFAERWVKHFNGTRAAQEAGYTGSRKTLGVRACKLRNNPKVRSYFGRLMCPEADKIDATYLKRQLLKESLSAPHSRHRLKGLELLARSIGALRDVHEHDISRQPAEKLLAGLAKTRPELAKLLAPLLGVEWPPLDNASGPPELTAPPTKA